MIFVISVEVDLVSKGSWNEWSRNILVDVFTTHGDEEISALFNEINSAQPVRLVDMPGVRSTFSKGL